MLVSSGIAVLRIMLQCWLGRATLTAGQDIGRANTVKSGTKQP